MAVQGSKCLGPSLLKDSYAQPISKFTYLPACFTCCCSTFFLKGGFFQCIVCRCFSLSKLLPCTFLFFLNIDISMLSGLLIQDLQCGIRWIASLISTLSPEGMRCNGQKLNNLLREEGMGVLFFGVERRGAVNPNHLLIVIDKLDSHELYWSLSNVAFWFYTNRYLFWFVFVFVFLFVLNLAFNKMKHREGA